VNTPGGSPRRDNPVRYAGLGVSFAATVGVLAYAGYWIDGKLGSSPAFLLAGVLLGFLGATFSLIRHVPPPSRSKTPPE
jgi:F0F1-type ATP synthase assembly protein I